MPSCSVYLTRAPHDVLAVRELPYAASITAGALITPGGAALFSRTRKPGLGVGAMALRTLVVITDSPAVLAIPIILSQVLVVGTFLEPVPGLIIIVPVMAPIIQHLGFHPVHFGIITIMMLVYGSVTPPVGILAMVVGRIAGIEYSRSFRLLVPYSLAWLAVALGGAGGLRPPARALVFFAHAARLASRRILARSSGPPWRTRTTRWPLSRPGPQRTRRYCLRLPANQLVRAAT